MDLTCAHIPMGDGSFEILYSQERVDRHVIDPNGLDYVSECDYVVPPWIIEYDPSDLPFMQEHSINMILLKTYEYKEKLTKYQGKEPGSIQILKKKDEECEETIKGMVNTDPPSYPYIESIPCINFSEGILALIWDKTKGKPRYDHRDDNSWLDPYIIKKKSDKENYYLTALDGRKMPLPVDGSLFQPYV
jgi:hypothetical protein